MDFNSGPVNICCRALGSNSINSSCAHQDGGNCLYYLPYNAVVVLNEVMHKGPERDLVFHKTQQLLAIGEAVSLLPSLFF